jgi:hypothetical protein
MNRAHRLILADAEGNPKPVRKPRLNFSPYLFGQVVVVCHTSTVVMVADSEDQLTVCAWAADVTRRLLARTRR